MTTNLEIVQQAYAAFAKGDVAGILANRDLDIVWENPGPDTIAYFGWHRGHAAVATNVFGFLHENMQFSLFEPYEFLVSTDRVAVLLRLQSSVRRTGVQLKEEAVHVFTLQNGRVVRFQDFQNSYNLAKALGA